jgi:putative heme-binding domain-containing protein
MVLSADAGRNVVFGYHPGKQRSGYDLGKRHNFITSLRDDNEGYVWNDSAGNAQPDKWFRPSDVAVGTDGALYVADWFDPVVGGHQMHDSVGYGRIYRITPKGKNLRAPEIDLSTLSGQLDALRSPAINVRYTAFNKLRQLGVRIIPEVQDVLEDENPFHHARAIWLLSQLGDAGVKEVEKMLDDDDDERRVVAFRALRQANAKKLQEYAEKLAGDRSPRVRREVALALKDAPYANKRDLWLRLADGYDGEDRWYLEALGLAMESHADDIYPELVKRFAGAKVSAEEWDNKLANLVWRLHPALAVNDLNKRASAESLGERERTSALTALAFINSREAVQAMISLARSQNKSIAEQATYWLTFKQGNDWLALWDWKRTGIDLEYERKVALMKVRRNMVLDAKMPLDEKKRNARAMARDVVGVHMLLGMVSEGLLPGELSPFVEELFSRHDNESVRIQAANYFGKRDDAVRYTPAAIGVLKKNAAEGAIIFEKTCSTCHRVGNKGGTIGPDLTGIKNKFDRDALLDAIINPDAGIVFGYEAWTVNLKDGQSFFGFLLAENPQTLTLKDLSGKNHVLEISQIHSRKKQDKSVMPSPESLGLSEQDLADLSEYLMSLR